MSNETAVAVRFRVLLVNLFSYQGVWWWWKGRSL